MSEKIVQLNKEVIKGQIKELVRSSVEENLNELLGKEAESLTQAIPATSAARPVIRATAAATMTATSPRLPATSRSTCLVSRACPSRLPSSRCTWQAFPCAVGQQDFARHHQRAEQESLRSHRGLVETAPCRADAIHTSTWTASTCAATGAGSTKM